MIYYFHIHQSHSSLSWEQMNTSNWPAPNISGVIALSWLEHHTSITRFKPRWCPEFFSGFFVRNCINGVFTTVRIILHLCSFEFFFVLTTGETIWTQASKVYSPGLEYKLTSGVGLCDLLAVFLGDAMTRSLVGDWGGEAGAVNDTGGGNNLALGDKTLPSPDLPQRREIIIIIINNSGFHYWVWD